MIRLRIVQEEGGFWTRVLLYAKDSRNGRISAPEYDPQSRRLVFRTLTPEEEANLYTISGDGTHPFEILQVHGCGNEDSGAQMIQGLLDDLWRQGFRPSDAVDRTDTLKAQDKHIADLNEARKELASLAKAAIERIPQD